MTNNSQTIDRTQGMIGASTYLYRLEAKRTQRVAHISVVVAVAALCAVAVLSFKAAAVGFAHSDPQIAEINADA
ncbi:MAG: hypothetical protein AAFR68_16655 [Pseudomonadota bacterium]